MQKMRLTETNVAIGAMTVLPVLRTYDSSISRYLADRSPNRSLWDSVFHRLQSPI